MLGESVSLFREYFDAFDSADKELFHVNAEISKKLDQVNWLVVNAQALHQEFFTNFRKDPVPRLDLIGPLEIYTESFYHFSFRVRDLLRKYHPRFSSFEARGVRDVRNHLIIHPEGKKDSAKLFSTFGFTVEPDVGPKIKGYIGPKEAAEDKGLFSNALEFNDNLSKLLRSVIAGGP